MQFTSEPVYFLKNILTDSHQQLFLWFQAIQIYLMMKSTNTVNSIIYKSKGGKNYIIH